jgi:hypothetical protein
MTLKRLTILIASFNDRRIVDAIQSIRRFDDVGTVKIIIIDGGSDQDIRTLIRDNITPDDIFVCEPDNGIFDGLNKGLILCDTEYMGWLGSDDRFTCRILASEVLAELEFSDIFVANLAFFSGNKILRITYSLPIILGLLNYGFHNPHYATFGRVALLSSERFDLNLMGADIDYFHRIFAKKPKIKTSNKISTLQFSGGYSNSSYKKILSINIQLLDTYSLYGHKILSPFAILIKILYKLSVTIYFKTFPLYVEDVELLD